MTAPPGPSLVMQMVIFERYGARLDTDDLADVTKQARGTVLNQISAGRFPIPTYVDCGRRWADFRDVAAYLDSKQREAHASALPA